MHGRKRDRRHGGDATHEERREGEARAGAATTRPRPPELRLVITPDGRIVLRGADTYPPPPTGEFVEDVGDEWG
jgi:hypothetical protein